MQRDNIPGDICIEVTLCNKKLNLQNRPALVIYEKIAHFTVKLFLAAFLPATNLWSLSPRLAIEAQYLIALPKRIRVYVTVSKAPKSGREMHRM